MITVPAVEVVVRFLQVGTFLPEERSEVLQVHPDWNAEWDTIALMASAHAVAADFCFELSTRTVAYAGPPLPGYRVLPEVVRRPGRWYLGGEVFDLGTIEAMAGSDDRYRVLWANCQGNGWPAMIRCRHGNWQPFLAEDHRIILTTTGGRITP